MPVASRRTLALRPKPRAISRLRFFGGLVGFTALLAYFYPFAAAMFGFICLAFGIASWAVGVQEHGRQAKVAVRRGGESICTFVRGFDCRRTDTQVLRAVYEELQPLVGFPLRADDQLEANLRLYDEDLDWDIAPIIAHRTGRPLRDTERNPHYGQVRTVADLVAFFCAQPLTTNLPRV